MGKFKKWFKKHLTMEVFSFLGLVFSIGTFIFNAYTNKIVPLQLSLLDSETMPYTDQNIFYMPYMMFSVALLSIAAICLYFLIRKKR